MLLIVMFGLTVGELLNDMAGGRIPPGLLTDLLFLNIPEIINTVIPIGVFMAIIWGLGRLFRDQEMAVMRASGFSLQMLMRPLFNLLVPVAVLVFVIGVYVAPSSAQAVQLKLENAFRTAAEWGLQTGQFHVLQKGNLILYVEAVEKDGRTLRNIFIQLRQNDREQIWVAEEGYYWLDTDTGVRYLTLENGQITAAGESALDYGIVSFSRNDLRLPDPEAANKRTDVKARPSKDILFSAHPEEAAEIQWRVSPAIAIVVLGLLAIPLAHSAPREGRSGRVLLGILVYMVYANLLYMDRSWIAKGVMPPALGLWWVHLLMLAIAIFWLRRQGRKVGGG